MQNNKGFTLVETVVSLVLLSIIVLAFFNTYFSVKKYNDISEKRRLSFQLCQDVLSQIDQNKVEINKGKFKYASSELIKLMINKPEIYKFVDKLLIKIDPLYIQGKLIKNLFKIKLTVSWSGHTFSVNTIARGGGRDKE